LTPWAVARACGRRAPPLPDESLNFGGKESVNKKALVGLAVEKRPEKRCERCVK